MFIIGFTCEAGHKNLPDGRSGVEKGAPSFREILSTIKILPNPVDLDQPLSNVVIVDC